VRRRLVISTIAIVLVVLGALAVPIGLIVYDAAERQIGARLEQQATSIVNALVADANAGREPDYESLTEVLGPNDGLQVFDADGRLIHRFVPPGVTSTRSTARTAPNGTRIIVLTNADPLDEQFREQLNILLFLAAVQGHQLARPLERMAKRAARIGDGDFSVQSLPKTHIPEIDRIGSALDTSAQRVDRMLANERHFTADATHQLRTGLAGLAMRFEILAMNPDPEVAAEARAGLSQTDQLNETIDELLAKARQRTTRERTVFDLTAFVNDHANEWKPRFDAAKRHLAVITANPPPPVYGTKGLAGQVIDILIDNALRHGEGTVTLMIDGPSVIVIDQGPGIPPEKLKTAFDGPVDPAAAHGRGLSLARRLAQVDGATLDVVGNRPLRLRFTLVRGDQRIAD
jgi:signal transduction histidine kinase